MTRANLAPYKPGNWHNVPLLVLASPSPCPELGPMLRAVTAQLIPAIALAFVVSFGWFLVAYRLYKRDLPLGPNNL
ncbi:hypothetical protein SAMN03159463_05020 [Mesorhizobium sp. NFR06]|uniref:hypothetical protein n=1 Tax=Mesorhizobium sp. NFR06 TaxID=1566290 RepID=UPI0008EEB684|nr:hypothetical protein [Mesorhizobium sp. NFR06]SFP86504.1 hypothetical protein SAMN03159463_05020 [Mesorhizobium sp. NFR06]